MRTKKKTEVESLISNQIKDIIKNLENYSNIKLTFMDTLGKNKEIFEFFNLINNQNISKIKNNKKEFIFID